jgi:regulator of sirC expression with transglutaminase-like and TPR domain
VADGLAVLDPFDGGRAVELEELKRRLTLVYSRAVTSDEAVAQLAATATRKDILVRMLHNLKAIYINRPDDNAALAVVERILALRPDDPVEVRDRGMIYESLECFRAAQADLERYLRLAPQAADADMVRRHLAELAGRVARLN